MPATFDAASSAAVASLATFSWNHTCSGSNRALMVGVGQDNAAYPQMVTSVTYGGVSLTSQSAIFQVQGGVQIWYLLNPPSGTNSVVVTVSTTQNAAGTTSLVIPPSVTAIAQSASGVAGVISHGGYVGTGTSAEVVPTASATSLILDAITQSSFAHITGSKQTLRVTQAAAASSSNMYGSTAAGTGGNVTMGYNSTGGDAFWISTIEFTGISNANGDLVISCSNKLTSENVMRGRVLR